ncbi:helix-turn-helix domain-containing protein [Sphingomonas sp. LB-2]|uniref:helix-turn-helix domain-containing protein n=1 Tax=Sphingomonas caeni TaxID=2984949 RepID=UPI00222EFC78|nr:helix-turn-helix domain-containing protein [Sphingomonas caeni]MCW3847007.1 helix-turn-helix domain-containing protein [Sphingomonas caeni]
MKLMDISEVAKQSGLPAATLRFYEEKGLIESLGRRGLRRTFDPGVLEQLSVIALGRMAGFSLDEIGAMFGTGPRPEIDRALLATKAEALSRTIRQLGALKKGIEHAVRCPVPNQLECPSFRRLMKIAASRAGKARAARPYRTIR